jgi:outer membrane protein assembly factor BamB
VLLVLAVLLISGCSSAANQPSSVAAASAAISDAATPSETSTANMPEASASVAAPGTIVLDQSLLATVCTKPQADSTESTESTAGSILSVLPGAVALISCGAEVAGYDLNAGQVMWQQPFGTGTSTPSDDAAKITVVYATQHIYEFETDTVPADGLIAAYTTAKLTAYDIRTGQLAWSYPLEPDNKQIDASDAGVIEIPAKLDGQLETVVSLSGPNIGADVGLEIGLDSATGSQRWRRAPLEEGVTYLGGKLALQVGTSDPIVLTALDTATARQVWQQAYTASDVVLADGVVPQLQGHTIWFFATTGYDTFDLATGKHTAHVLYPVSFQHVLSTTSLTMAYVDNSLRLFRLGNWSKPIWSVTSDDATPLVVSDTVILVNAASGIQELAADTGSLESSSLSAKDIGSAPLTIQDGFAHNDTTVIAVGRPK